MHNKRKLMSKNGQMAMFLAREFINYNEGDRIRTIGEYASSFSTGRGTVQSAMKFLDEEKAVKLESRGHLGTFIRSIDYKKLWRISDFGVIMGVMPLPYSKRYEGLATGLYKAFEKADIPFSLAFMRGAEQRIQALGMGRYDFTITSKLAAIHEKMRFPYIEELHVFGPGSYVGNHIILFKDDHVKEIEDGMRVGIDTTSPDQFLLTRHECEGKNVEYVETSYGQIVEKLRTNEIDAAVWSEDEIKEKDLDFDMQPLKNPRTIEANKCDTMAAMVIDKGNAELKSIIKRLINLEDIEKIQKLVVEKQIIPMY